MAGSWGQYGFRGLGDYAGRPNQMFAMWREFTADAAAATVPDWDITNIASSFVADFGVVFDGTTPPDTVTLTIKDRDGLTVHEETGITASSRVALTDRPSVIGGCTISISGNTTNSAKAKVIINFASNR